MVGENKVDNQEDKSINPSSNRRQAILDYINKSNIKPPQTHWTKVKILHMPYYEQIQGLVLLFEKKGQL